MTGRIRRRLLAHYRRHKRDLPWRRTGDPYAIWVSEIMLQQTRVDTVVGRYDQFLERFPTVEDLASVDAAEVCEAWAGLGYYRRARNLHAAARQLVEEHDGELPRDVAMLRRLPGIGRYTAGAIASIAFGEEAPLVDGNVARVLSRLYALDSPPSGTAAQKQLWHLAESLVRGPSPGDLNQALMELGAILCSPRAPACERCPIRSDCRAHRAGTPERFPPAEAKRERRLLEIAFAWIPGRGGLWLERRPLEGLWSGLWELPSAEGGRAKAGLSARLGVELSRPIVSITHQLTHREVRARIYRTVQRPRFRTRQTLRRFEKPLSAPLSSLARKAISAALRYLEQEPG